MIGGDCDGAINTRSNCEIRSFALRTSRVSDTDIYEAIWEFDGL